jgi:translation initiation factor IF-3
MENALKRAKECGLDLVQVTKKVEPPVCKIIDYGKYLYQLQKKEKKGSRIKGGEIKGVRIKFNTSDHDLETKAKQAQKFIEKGNKIKLELLLRGREKALKHHIQEQIDKFLGFLKNDIPIEIEKESKKQRNSITIIIKKGQK